ncbi:MAG: decaprenyl-phosphate phosphoribosyltransferase [Actinomycetota bacterium]
MNRSPNPPPTDREEPGLPERLEVLILPSQPVTAATPPPKPLSRHPVIALLRPKQWAKNLLVFAAPGAAGLLTGFSVASRASVAFASLCLMASATYIVNDILDAPADRIHPLKGSRPVASGQIAVRPALVLGVALLVAGLAVATYLGLGFVEVVAAYVGLSVAYSLVLKRLEVIDIAVVAACFVLRAVAGAAATGVTLSSWFLILVSAGALLVVAGKRMADLRFAHREGIESFERRAVYPESFLRGVWVLSAAVAVMAYILWSQAFPHNIDGVAWSQVSAAPFVIALLRYTLIIERGGAGAPEDVFKSDHVLQAVVLVWLVAYAIGVYL